MSRKIFVNLPVKDLQRSIDFYVALGFTLNPQFTDQTAACIIVSEEIYVMLLTEPKFSQFTPRPISDATKASEVLIALSCDSREEVGRLTETALGAGGDRVGEPKDYGFMIQDGFADPDGHIWELIFMNPEAADAPCSTSEAAEAP